MLGFIKYPNRKSSKITKASRAPCSRVLHADSVATFAVGHSRIPYSNISGRAITTLETYYTHFSYNTSLEWSPTSMLTVRAAVEYPVGTITPLSDMNGNRDIAITGGEVSAALKATGLNIPNNAVYYIRTRVICAGGDGQLPRAYSNGAAFEGGNIQSYLSTTNDGADYTTAGNQPTSSGKGFGPSAVCSVETGNKNRSFAIIGDSISRGSLSGGVSFSEIASIGAGYGFLNLSYSGAKIQNNTTMLRRRALMQAIGITDVLMNFPVNDLSAGRTLAQIQADSNTLWTNLKADGIQKVIQATCLPYTTDNTSPGTIVVTPAGAFTGGASSLRSQINAWFRSVEGQTNKPSHIFEFADILETARDSGLWLNPTTNTTEGLHPSATGATLAGNAYTTFLQSKGF